MVDGRWVPTFSNAKYVFARDEYRSMEEEYRQIFVDSVQPIAEARQAVLVDLDYTLDDEIWLEPRLGHPVGHVVIHVKSRRSRAAMCGDLIHSPLQLAQPEWTCDPDYDLAASAATRKKFLEEHCDTDSLVLTAHFPSPSMGYVVSRRNAYDFNYL